MYGGGDEGDFPALGGPVSKSKGKGRGKGKDGPPSQPSQPAPGELSQAAPPKKSTAAPPPAKHPSDAAPKAPPKAPPKGPEAAIPKPPPKKAAAPPAEAVPKAAEAPHRFGAEDYEAAAEHDAEAERRVTHTDEPEDRLKLDIPSLSLGKSGSPVKLVTNHFQLSVKSQGTNTVWRCWRVDFTKMEEDKPKDLREKKMPKKRGDDEREVPKAIRKKAVEVLMEGVQIIDWLHDGNNLLYTRKSVTTFQDSRREIEVPPTKTGGRPYKVCLEVKFEGRELDLAWIHQPQVSKDPAESMVAMSEHRRFVQVAIRTLAQERDELIAQGRKVICPDRRLVCDAVGLKYGREMWFGYIGQVEIVNGGAGVGGRLGPPRSTLSLNLVASVGLPEMPVIKLLGKLGARKPGDRRSEDECEKEIPRKYWDGSYARMRDALRGELGLKRLKVKAEYGKVKVSNKVVYGVSDKPANRQEFDCEEMGGKVNVVQYFKHKHGIDVGYPDLPCIQLGSARNCIPMEFVTVLGGEHNLAVGKLRPEFQVEVTRRTAMPPSQRRDQIMTALNNPQLGPASALNSKGITMELQMIKLNGRLLDTPKMRDGNTGNSYMGTSTNYSNNFKAISPPQFEVAWGMWCFTTGSQIQERDIWWLAGEFKKRCYAKGMNFTDAKTIEWPQKAFDAYYRCWKNRESFSNTLGNVLREELTQLLAKHKDLKLLVILLEDSEAITDQLYKLIKLITETEMGSFTTQFVNCKNGIADAEKKLNNLMLKVTPKVPAKAGIPRAAFNVALAEPHRLLKKEEGTMIMGADVTHNVAGISVAGVVASVDSSFASYFHEIRGQSPYTLNTLKQRNRQSEERIIDLTSMAQNLLQKWRKMNGRLPNNIIYYRDGVSDGQFVNVLQRELNLLDAAFKNVEATYEPRLVIIVGQKRHQTRLWMADDTGKGGGKDKGKGKKDPAQVRPGTVASDNIAQPSHMNFFLVSQEGIQGTSVPCHYHILHLDKRLVQRGIKVDDFEIITFQLCHLYSRADKSVGYATPAYMADHVCERGKHYLEAYFGHSDVMSILGTSSSEERKESEMREEIEKRISWLNERAAASSQKLLNGLQVYC